MFRPLFAIFGLFTVITGVAYPLVVTLVAKTTMPTAANGSLIVQGDKIVGSELIGQQFDDAKYFWSRPSATTPGYNGASSSGSNLGPTNPDLHKAIGVRVEAIRKAHPEKTGAIPVDMLTASASGLDPHITPAAAEFQIERIAKERGLSIASVQKLVTDSIEGRTLGLLGEARVNVLLLNRKLDEMKP